MRGIIAAAFLVFLAPVAIAQNQSVRTRDMDTTCAACKDFFTYANGGWVKQTKIPADYPMYDGFFEAYDQSLAAMHRILDEAAKHAATSKDANERKIGAFYASCMDSSLAERTNLTPIKPLLDSIDGMKSSADVMRMIASLHRQSIPAGFNMTNEMDPKASDRMIGQLYQGGLGLPDRDYYTNNDPKSDSTKAAYVAHVAKIFTLAGGMPSDAKLRADRVMALETRLAQASMTIVQQRDPKAIYHKMSVADLEKLAPGVNWVGYFKAVGVPQLASASATLDVSQPEFFTAFATMLHETPIEDWRAYLRWQLLHSTANSFDNAFVQANFDLDKVLSGVDELQPRWKRCVTLTDGNLGEALGQVYVTKEFSPAAKARMIELVANLQAVFNERIANSSWMSATTKARAQTKLAAFTKKIAYPDRWRDYSALSVSARAPFVKNRLAARAFEFKRQMGKINKPTDRLEWGMTPPTVNAYYNSLNNEIVFPAGILAPPFFDPKAEDAVNYGGIGMVIGHEMTHGFDDQGRQYDAKGNLTDWWTAEDAKGFTDRAQQVVDQYGSYVVVDTLRINGKQTLGENLADIGGLTLAYYAYQRSLVGKPRPPIITGFTPEQRFFIGAAQAWHAVSRPEYDRLLVATDVHSPDKWRVNGAVSAMPEFAAAFGCKDADPMVRPNAVKVRIW